MVKLKKIFSVLIILVMLMEVSSTATDEIIGQLIDENKEGTLTINVLQDENGSIVHKNEEGKTEIIGEAGNGESNQKYDENLKAISNVYFKLYKVGDEDSLETAQLKLSSISEEEVTEISDSNTDESGTATFNNLRVGRYYVLPTKFPSNVNIEIDPFLVDIPSTSADHKKWNYDVVVYPKVQTVYASIVLNLKDGEEYQPLQGAVYQLFKKDSLTGNYIDIYTNEEHINKEEYETDQFGQIFIENLPAGEYALIEKSASSGYGVNRTPVEFKITAGTIDSIEEDGSHNITPKVETDKVSQTVYNYLIPTSDNFEFKKQAGDQVSSGIKIDQEQTWKISSKIPGNVEDYSRFLIVDQLSKKLKFVDDSVKVYVDDEEAIKDEDYKMDFDESNNTLKVSLVLEDSVSSKIENGKMVVIEFKTTFNRESIELGEPVSNYADVYFDTKYDEDGDDEGEDPMNPEENPDSSEDPDNPENPKTPDDTKKKETVGEPADFHTGGLKGKKVGENNEALQGAIFKIAVSEEDAKKGNYVQIDGEDITAVSDEDGIFKFSGLSYGEEGQNNDEASSTYYLVEVQAPAEYNLLKKPEQVTINKDTHKDVSVTIVNKKGIVLPVTGGIGTIIFIVIGGSLMAFAIIVFIKRKKEEDSEEEENK